MSALASAKPPYDLAEQFETRGNHFADGQTLKAVRPMGVGKDKRDQRVVYPWSFKRYQHDNRAINRLVERAEKVADGFKPVKKDRFVRFTDVATEVDWGLVERARYLGRVEGLRHQHPGRDHGRRERRRRVSRPVPGRAVLRMVKSDLAARPMFHQLRESIDAHLTVVFVALAVSREAQARTGLSTMKILQTLRPLRSATISLGGQQVTAPPHIPDDVRSILGALVVGGH